MVIDEALWTLTAGNISTGEVLRFYPIGDDVPDNVPFICVPSNSCTDILMPICVFYYMYAHIDIHVTQI